MNLTWAELQRKYRGLPNIPYDHDEAMVHIIAGNENDFTGYMQNGDDILLFAFSKGVLFMTGWSSGEPPLFQMSIDR
jgi:hypothetical protein